MKLGWPGRFNSLGLRILPFVRSRCVRHLFPDARCCRVALVLVADVARWDTSLSPWVGIPCLMYAVALSHGMRRLIYARKWACRLSSVVYHPFCFLNLGFSDTYEDKVRNAHKYTYIAKETRFVAFCLLYIQGPFWKVVYYKITNLYLEYTPLRRETA